MEKDLPEEKLQDLELSIEGAKLSPIYKEILEAKPAPQFAQLENLGMPGSPRVVNVAIQILNILGPLTSAKNRADALKKLSGANLNPEQINSFYKLIQDKEALTKFLGELDPKLVNISEANLTIEDINSLLNNKAAEQIVKLERPYLEHIRDPQNIKNVLAVSRLNALELKELYLTGKWLQVDFAKYIVETLKKYASNELINSLSFSTEEEADLISNQIPLHLYNKAQMPAMTIERWSTSPNSKFAGTYSGGFFTYDIVTSKLLNHSIPDYIKILDLEYDFDSNLFLNILDNRNQEPLLFNNTSNKYYMYERDKRVIPMQTFINSLKHNPRFSFNPVLKNTFAISSPRGARIYAITDSDVLDLVAEFTIPKEDQPWNIFPYVRQFLKFSPSGKYLAQVYYHMGSPFLHLLTFDYSNNQYNIQSHRTLLGNKENLLMTPTLAFSPNHKYLAASVNDKDQNINNLLIWDLDNISNDPKINIISDDVRFKSLNFYNDDILLALKEDGSLWIFNVNTGKSNRIKLEEYGYFSKLNLFAIDPNTKYVIAFTTDGKLYVFDIQDLILTELQEHLSLKDFLLQRKKTIH